MLKLGEETLSWPDRASTKMTCRHCARLGHPDQIHEERKDPRIGWVSICLNCGMVEEANVSKRPRV